MQTNDTLRTQSAQTARDEKPATDVSITKPAPAKDETQNDAVETKPRTWSDVGWSTTQGVGGALKAVTWAAARGGYYVYTAATESYQQWRSDWHASDVAIQLAEHLQTGRTKEARKLIAKLSTQHHVAGAVHLQCVDALLTLGDYDSAVALCRAPHTRMEPEEVERRLEVAEALKTTQEALTSANYAKAVYTVADALRQSPVPAPLRLKASEAFATVGQYRNAIKHCNELIDSPLFSELPLDERAGAHRMIALASLCRGHYPEAIAAADKALQIDNADIRSRLFRGLAHQLHKVGSVVEGDDDYVERENSAATLIDPFLQTTLGICAHAMGDTAGANEVLDGVLGEGGTAPDFPLAAAYKALLELNESKHDVAEQRVRSALSKTAMARGHLYVVAALAWRPGSDRHYTVLLNEALNSDNTLTIAHYANVSLSLTMGTKEGMQRAMRSIQRLEEINPDDALLYMAKAELAVATLDQGDATEKLNSAWSFLNDALAKGAVEKTVAQHQGTVQWLLGQRNADQRLAVENYKEAQKYADLAMEAHPRSAAPLALRGQILLAQRKYAEAVIDLEKALGLDPSRGDAYLGYSKACLGLLAQNGTQGNSMTTKERAEWAGRAAAKAKIFLAQAQPGHARYGEGNLALARACFEAGVIDEALNACNKVVDPHLREEKNSLLAEIQSLRDEVQAVDDATNLAALEQLEPRTHFLAVREMVLRNGGNPQPLIALAKHERTGGALDSAEQHLVTALNNLQPGDPLRKSTEDLLRAVRDEKETIVKTIKKLYDTGKEYAPLLGTAANTVATVLFPGKDNVPLRFTRGLIKILANTAWDQTPKSMQKAINTVLEYGKLVDNPKTDEKDSDTKSRNTETEPKAEEPNNTATGEPIPSSASNHEDKQDG